ncbi:MAG: rRNA-binding ribosome biosynthesis protein utp25 [Bogoriella megaspora]|nr:MAG: rRNA-binding ribosome biosynthesis protein utp25 [Bogoriella megaspora]
MAPLKSRKQATATARSRERNKLAKKERFANQRVVDLEDIQSEERNEHEHLSLHDDDDDNVSEEQVEQTEQIKPYNILLQSLQQEVERGEPRRKRRKVNISTAVEDLKRSASDTTTTLEVNPLLEEEDDGDEDDTAELAARDHALNEDDDTSDPFKIHLDSWNEQQLAKLIEQMSARDWQVNKRESQLGKVIRSVPSLESNQSNQASNTQPASPSSLNLKSRLMNPAGKLSPQFDQTQRELAPLIFQYSDLLFTSRTVQNAGSLRFITCLHALNHVYKTRDRVLRDNAKLGKLSNGEDLEFRDQGFTRPKVLFLLETRQACAKAIETMMKLCVLEQQENKKRFQDEYNDSEEKFTADRPEDFRELFEGNDDNDFRLGLKFTRKTVKFFSPFYNSDIILASALGLRRIIENDDPKKRDHDFLSSIEVVVVDQADAMLQQNWEHVELVFSHLNLQPKEAHGCDFSRVRNWYLDGNAKYLRQTIILSAYNTPELNSLFNKNMLNVSGKVKVQPEYDGSYLSINFPLKQTFSRMDSASPAADPDARFKYFTSAIIPSLTRHNHPADSATGGAGVLIFIPSYLDFVRVRNFFANSTATQNISFGLVSEYTSTSEVRRARAHFVSGRHSVLLYSGRAHHFRRYNIKGVERVVFYGLPDNPLFYREVVEGFLGQTLAEGKADSMDLSVRAVFSKWDALKLERIVGTKRVGSMLREKQGDTFDFVS